MPVLFITLLMLLGGNSVAMATSLPSQAMVIGDGYNILSGNPDGRGWLSGGEDPGLLFAHKVFQIETDQEVTNEVSYHNHGSCQRYLGSEIVYSPASYQDKLMKTVTLDGLLIPSLQAAAFTQSSGYQDVKQETSGHNHVIYDKQTTCVVANARYKMSLVKPGHFGLTSEVTADICVLPNTQNLGAYTAFIDKWGTHVITEVQLGHRETVRSSMNASDFISYVQKKAPSDISDGGQIDSAASSYQVDVTSFKSRIGVTDSIGQMIGTLKTGSDATPEPVSLGLTSIDVVFSPAFWEGNEEMYAICPDNITSTIAMKRQFLQEALQKYASSKGAEVPNSKDLVVPVRWPSGTYALPKSATGCPVEERLWEEGWLKQIPEAQTPDSSWTANHLDATLTKRSFLLRYCVKTVTADGLSMSWPRGDYCIFKYHVCPPGFAEGFVRHDDENTNNSNSHSGTLPSGDYGTDTLIRYCCRSDGSMYDPITLPKQKPFYLFRYKHGCQEVKDMTSSVESLLWDDDDEHPNSTALAGAVHPGMVLCNPPKVTGCGTGTKIFYCYYKPKDTGGSLSIIG